MESPPKSTPPKRPYYLCQRCGNCCRWPGDVRVGDREIAAIADHLDLDEWDFRQRYTRLTGDRRGLSLADAEDGSCIFLEQPNVCRIQAVKPVQCQGFPNRWNFPGWREVCEAIPVTANPQTSAPTAARDDDDGSRVANRTSRTEPP